VGDERRSPAGIILAMAMVINLFVAGLAGR
jgi:hypothetical protein